MKKICILIALMTCLGSARAEEKMAYYLFAYFTDNSPKGQQVCYAVSENGLDFVPLNNGQPILASDSMDSML